MPRDTFLFPVCVLPLVIGVIVDLLRTTALSFQKGGMIKVPRTPYTPSARDIHGDKWTNYPALTEKTKSHNHCVFKAMYDVSLITYDLTWSLFGNEKRKFNARSVEKAEDAFARLSKWYKGFPDCLEVTNAPPHILSLQFVFPNWNDGLGADSHDQYEIPHHHPNHLWGAKRPSKG